ncbi:uncharacterized protein LOC104441990 [Eucalyptus grandis]|uniref:uncharacterized protein LOC104441990 n=1 Tax=Eucalyptus grandis TaxID=71139 RepID=UPI00192E7E49|nr:uncharacterized protein LOC104441990 [Eucalyptus grandis]
MEISHFSHEHPLTLCTAEDAGEPCNGCSRPIFDLGYVCYDCGFLLHKKCAKLPRKAHHRLHPKHPLTLLFNSSETFQCNVCKKTGSGFAFRCCECQYVMDVTCFLKHQPYLDPFPLEGKTRKLQHFSHQKEHPFHPSHSLTLFTKSLILLGEYCVMLCGKVVSGFVYHCDKCSFDLDSTFFEELNIQVPCNSCCKPCSNDLYRCVTCNFNVHSTCLPFPRTVKHIHHCHSLILKDSTLEEDPSGILCATCKKKISPTARAYYCAECSYGVHLERVVSEEQSDQGKLLQDIARVREELDAIAAQLKRDKKSGSTKIQA